MKKKVKKTKAVPKEKVVEPTHALITKLCKCRHIGWFHPDKGKCEMCRCKKFELMRK